MNILHVGLIKLVTPCESVVESVTGTTVSIFLNHLSLVD